jgi:hypothetical protein
LKGAVEIWREGLKATKFVWDQKAQCYVDTGFPDWDVRERMSLAIAAYMEGKPIERQINVTGNFEELGQVLNRIRASPIAMEELADLPSLRGMPSDSDSLQIGLKVKKRTDDFAPDGYVMVMKTIIGNEETVDERQKNFLTEAEIERFLKSSRYGRHGVRNFAMMLLAYRHGLRVSELVNMRIADVDLDTGRLFVRRCKGSLSTSQPLDGDEFAPCEPGCGSESMRRAAIHLCCSYRSADQ